MWRRRKQARRACKTRGHPQIGQIFKGIYRTMKLLHLVKGYLRFFCIGCFLDCCSVLCKWGRISLNMPICTLNVKSYCSHIRWCQTETPGFILLIVKIIHFIQGFVVICFCVPRSQEMPLIVPKNNKDGMFADTLLEFQLWIPPLNFFIYMTRKILPCFSVCKQNHKNTSWEKCVWTFAFSTSRATTDIQILWYTEAGTNIFAQFGLLDKYFIDGGYVLVVQVHI